MFGRDAECAAAVALFDAGARVVSIAGAAGIGKTRVAHEVARRVAGDAAAYVCALGDVRDASGLVRAIVRAASLRAGSSSRRVDVDAVARALASCGRVVLVLDDADAVVGHVAAFARACGALCEEARLVVTSREPLAIDAERVVRLGPLDRSSAVAMFAARAERDVGEGHDVGALVDALDGIPLAIEIAARRASVMTPGELLARIDDRFRLLRSERRDVAERHVALARAIEWSWELFDDDERAAFAAAGVFAGAFTVDAFEAVVGPASKADALDVAEALLRKSMLVRAGGDGAARLTMLGTLRAFARGKLTERDHDAVGARHAQFFLERAERAAARAYGRDADAALDALDADLPELVAAFERERTRAPAVAARIAVALGDLALFRDVVDLRSALFADARQAADASGDAPLRVRARVLGARVALELAAPADAEALLVDAVGIAAAHERDATPALADAAADAHRSLGWARLANGRADAAIASIEAALAHHRASGDVRGEADALAASGVAACMRGAIDDGHRAIAHAHALHVAAKDAIRREKVAEIAKVVGLDLGDDGARADELAARLRASAAAHGAHGRVLREAMDLFRLGALTSAAARAVEPPARPWSIAPDARALGTPSGERIDLARHGALRRILAALVAKRIAAPGVALTADALLDAGWPGERVRYDAGMLRVYTAVRRLRNLGFGAVLLTRDDGYLMDPTVAFVAE